MCFEGGPPHPKLYSRFDVVVGLPDGVKHTVRGTIVDHSPTGFEVHLQVTSEMEWTLATAADSIQE